jgi:hypothetical protein
VIGTSAVIGRRDRDRDRDRGWATSQCDGKKEGGNASERGGVPAELPLLEDPSESATSWEAGGPREALAFCFALASFATPPMRPPGFFSVQIY